MAEAGARLAIRLLQDAAERGEIDPWDVDVIAVVDGFLDQLRQRIGAPRLVSRPGEGGSFESDLAVTSEAFLAASVLVSLKAEILEQQTLPQEPEAELDTFAFGDEDAESFELLSFQLPRRPERHLLRRAVAPPPLQRPVTLGELIRQLEDIAERLE
ncbi:MAG: segregation/condensation protein A, partial [Cyanobacteria bacterium]|nr:segregation/condensation protein A [Cyanobacteriota bacterium]